MYGEFAGGHRAIAGGHGALRHLVSLMQQRSGNIGVSRERAPGGETRVAVPVVSTFASAHVIDLRKGHVNSRFLIVCNAAADSNSHAL